MKKFIILSLLLVFSSCLFAQGVDTTETDDSVQLFNQLNAWNIAVDADSGVAAPDAWWWSGFVIGYIVGDSGTTICRNLQKPPVGISPDPLPIRKKVAQYYYDLPDNVTRGEITKVITRYINQNPTTMHETPTATIDAALIQAYPCVVQK